MRWTLYGLILTFGLVVSPGVAAQSELTPYTSCEREPTDSDVAAAKGAFEAGQVSFHEADYGRAILYWEDAFRRDCTAVKLLLNLARAYELSGKKERAILALETYLERRPDSPDRGSIEKRISNLRKQVRSEQATAESAKETTPPPSEEEDPASDESAPPAATSPTTETATARSPRPVWPVVVTGVGLVAGGVGLGLYIEGGSTLANVDCPERLVDEDGDLVRRRVCVNQEEEQRAQAAQTRRNAGGGLAVAGGALAVTGGVLWLILWNQDGEATARTAPHLTPRLGPTFAGLSFETDF